MIDLLIDGNNRISKILFQKNYSPYWTIDYTTSPAKVKTYGSDGYETPGSIVILNSLGYVTKRSNKTTNIVLTFDYDASGYLIKSLEDFSTEQRYFIYTYTDGNLSLVKEYITSIGRTELVSTLMFTYYPDKLNTSPMQYLPNVTFPTVLEHFELVDVYSIPNFMGKYTKNLIKTVTYITESSYSSIEYRSKQDYTYFNDANGNIGKMNIVTTYNSDFRLPNYIDNRTIYFTFSCK